MSVELGLWIPSAEFRINKVRDSGLHKQKCPGFWIPQATFLGFSPESGLAYMGRDSSCMQAVAIGLIARTVPCRITGDFILPTRSPEHF